MTTGAFASAADGAPKALTAEAKSWHGLSRAVRRGLDSLPELPVRLCGRFGC
jgi:hypothetical protein